MKTITECAITVMENLLFVSTEFGNEYRAYDLIGNTAIPYAIGLCEVVYKQYELPRHRQDFNKLNEKGIYVTPVTFIGETSFKIERFNCMPEKYDLTWKKDASEKGGRTENYPDEGYFKMIERGNKGVFFIISEDEVQVPAYARIGKFMSKCKIETFKHDVTEKKGIHDANIILRAEDIDPSIQIIKYQKIPIQHGMYLRNVKFSGDAFCINSKLIRKEVCIPLDSSFYATEKGSV